MYKSVERIADRRHLDPKTTPKSVTRWRKNDNAKEEASEFN